MTETSTGPTMVSSQEVARHLGDRVLDLLHVGRDVAMREPVVLRSDVRTGGSTCS